MSQRCCKAGAKGERAVVAATGEARRSDIEQQEHRDTRQQYSHSARLCAGRVARESERKESRGSQATASLRREHRFERSRAAHERSPRSRVESSQAELHPRLPLPAPTTASPLLRPLAAAALRRPFPAAAATMSTAAPASSKTAPPAQNTAKRDFLIALEHKAQQRWLDDKLFEQNSPYATGEAQVPDADFAQHADELRKKYPKVLATMPYPVRLAFLQLHLLQPRSARLRLCEHSIGRATDARFPDCST